MKKYIMLMAAVMLLLTAQGQKLTLRVMEDNAREWGLKMGKKAPVMMQRVELEGVESLAVYNYKDGGFVIVSGDGRARPVLGYSHRGSVNAGALPANVKYWLQEYQRQMDSLDMMDSEYLTTRKWNRAGAKDGYPDSVAPLLETEWTQARHGYNSLVPYDSTYALDSNMARFENHPTVGCVALAMGQVMRYWQFPQHGYGSHYYSYEGLDNCWHYGIVGTDFSSVTYDYANMPYKLTDTSSAAEVEAVATLLFHCGVASNMRYNSDCAGSSGASLATCMLGMVRFFHYSGDCRYEYRNNYTRTAWEELLKSDLAAGRPVIYGGQSYRNDDEGTLAGGHAFIFDGYDTMDYFHVNWGWGGSCNGYYSTTVLRPMVQYDFTPLQYCIINLKPNTDNGAVIVMASDLEMDSERFASGGDISGHYSMTNIGDSAGSMYVGVNIYDGGGTYHGCVDGRKVTLGVGDTVRCDFAYPLMLETGTYSAVMQYSMDSFCAGNPVDNTLYLPDFDYVNTADFEVIDTFIRELTNLVVFVRFRGDPEITTPFMTFKDMFNQSINSVAYFFREMSYGRIHFNTTFAKQNSGNGIVSYVDPMPRGYFQPYSDSNTIGYTTPNPQVGISMREAELIARVARYIDSARKVPELESLDGNYDGNIDNLSIIVQGDVDGWGELLWPHMEFFPQDSMDNPVTINGKRVHAFNFEFEGSGPSYFSTRTFCHEMCHSIGLPDLYHYNHYTRVTAVPFDLMGSGLMCQPSGIYKHKILHVGDAPVQITENGNYTISSNGSALGMHPRLYYIKSGLDTNQWYTIEYRNASDHFEEDLPYNGLVIGRWMDTVKTDILHSGNMFFDFDTPNAYWVFRPGSEIDTVNGNPLRAIFNAEQGLSEFGPRTDPHPYLADGTPERSFRIYDIVTNRSTCTFSVEFLTEGVESPVAEGNMRLYPNPATGSFSVTWPQELAGDEGCEVSVLDAVGHTVVKRRATGDKCEFDTEGFARGIYFVTLTTHKGLYTQKIILQ